ncbi:DUF1367 family protein [Serratia marcescens]|uniref:DUF1367 family protein n=1 Tax=Serratia marcescens TaxID=615 RepID=UPI003D70FCA8
MSDPRGVGRRPARDPSPGRTTAALSPRPFDDNARHGRFRYINRLARHVEDAGVFYALADEYLQLVAEKRAERLTIAKSFHAFRRWVTVEAGHYDLFELPDGSTLREPRSISFAKMDYLEFNDLYQAALNVLWTFILNKSFPTIAEAENAAAQLLDYAA